MWFEALMGFTEVDPEQVRGNIRIEGDRLISKSNGRAFQFGRLEIPTLQALRGEIDLKEVSGKITVSEIVGNVSKLHQQKENENALFQAASQFNLLEMASPGITPEMGVGIYENDHTQGPACAIACGAGTIYRNYFVPLHGTYGQSTEHQIDCLELLGAKLENETYDLWRMSNGYCFPSETGLKRVDALISGVNDVQREALKGKLKVGVQWNTEVTISEARQIVSQVYCSALPIGYSQIPEMHWKEFASLILEATYEATFYAGLFNYRNNGCNKIFLTLVGGGVFGNKTEWILEAIKKAFLKFKETPLDVRIVSYGGSNALLHKTISDLKSQNI